MPGAMDQAAVHRQDSSRKLDQGAQTGRLEKRCQRDASGRISPSPKWGGQRKQLAARSVDFN